MTGLTDPTVTPSGKATIFGNDLTANVTCR